MERSEVVKVRLTAEEKSQVEGQAREAGLSVSEFFRSRIFPGQPVKGRMVRGSSLAVPTKLPTSSHSVLADLKSRNDELGELCEDCGRKGLMEYSQFCVKQRKKDAKALKGEPA